MPIEMFHKFYIRLSDRIVLNHVHFNDGLEVNHQRITSVCNIHLAMLAQAISLGVRKLAFSSIAWTCDVTDTWEMFSLDEVVFGDSPQG